MDSPLRFHWSPHRGEYPRTAAAFVDLCRRTQSAGMESVEIRDDHLPGALDEAVAAGAKTETIRFRIACHANGTPPPVFAQQVRDAHQALGRRLLVHWHTPSLSSPDLDGADESLASCRAAFVTSDAPEIHVEGDSAEAAFLAIKRADCLWRLPHRPNQVYADALPVLHFGKEVGLVTTLLTGPTREDAFQAAKGLLPADSSERWDDPFWITSCLWTGAAPGHDLAPVILAGSFREVAMALYDFKRLGISQFLFRGLPCPQDLDSFASGVLPLVRALESGRSLD